MELWETQLVGIFAEEDKMQRDSTHIDEGHYGGGKLLAVWEAEGKRLFMLQV